MKIDIAAPKEWLGPYQLAEKIFFWVEKYGDDFDYTPAYDRVHNVGEFFAYGFQKEKEKDDGVFGDSRKKTWLYKLLLFIDKHKPKRKELIRIDDYDLWGMDHTVASILSPMLKKLKENKHGYPGEFATEDHNYGDQQIFEGPGFEFPEDHGAEVWSGILDKMIWSFDELLNDDREEQFSTGEIDLHFEKIDEYDSKGGQYSTLVEGPSHTRVTDYDAIARHNAKMQEGFDLFGKHFRSLWD